MTVNYNEILSALVDGELQGEELDQALQLLATDEQARTQLKRYQHTSDVLHGYSSASRNVNLTERILSALIDEPALIPTSSTIQKAPVLTFPQQFWKQAVGLAVAASVGALAVVGVMNQPQNYVEPAITPLAVVEQPESMLIVQSANRWTVGEAEVAERLNTYLLDHNEFNGAPDVFSYARVVSFGTEQ